MSWQAPFLGRDCDWELRTHSIDLDSRGRGDDQDAFSTNELALGFEDSVLDMAARAYRRECKWDFSPGDGGVWLIVLRPTSWSASEEHEERRSASGNLVGFLILHDRDADGEYESVAHIWTAARWRRRGIATHLLEQARARFPVAAIEGPPTELGAALVSARAAHLAST
jgi:ribosomal protein S18 acetylase RimI-like enzyme